MGDLTPITSELPKEVTPEEPKVLLDDSPPPIEQVVTAEVVKSILADYNPELKLIKFHAEPGSKHGDNYMSIMYALTIEVEGQDPLKIMLKTLPRNKMRQQMINDGEFFVKEISMYNKVFPDMVKFQRERGLGEDEIWNKYPLCYSTFHDAEFDYLALEDLRVTEYKLGNRLVGNDFNHCRLLLSELAQFHAISYAMFGGDYDAIKAKYPFLNEKMFRPEEEMQEMMKKFFIDTYKMESETLRAEGLEEDAQAIDNLANNNFLNRMYRITGMKVDDAVIAHGDCWTNNFMFQYGKDDKVKDIKFLDFQISRASSKTLDIGYFLHTSVPQDLYNGHEEELLRIYFDSWVDFSKKLGVKTTGNPVFNWEHFLNEYDEYRVYGVAMGLLLAPMLSSEAANIPNMEDMSEDMMNDPEAAKKFMGEMMKGKVAVGKYQHLAKHAKRIRPYNPEK